MPAVPKFTREDVKAEFDLVLNTIDKRIIDRLRFLGEECVIHAKEHGNYTDQTGNLRSSIGYTIFKNGVAIHESYEAKGGEETDSVRQKIASKVANKFPKGIVLVVVAGMNYALRVETKGYDVLTSAEIMAERELPKLVRELKSNLNKID